MMNSTKKINFSSAEIKCLMSMIVKFKDIIENKSTNAETNREKRKAWQRIAERYNALPGVTERTSVQLQTLYKNLKSKANKRMGNEKLELFKTGGGIKAISVTDIRKRIQNRLLAVGALTTPLENSFDSDTIDEQIAEITPDNTINESYIKENEICRKDSESCKDGNDISLDVNRDSPILEDVTVINEIPKIAKPQEKKDFGEMQFSKKRKHEVPSSITAAAALRKQAIVKTEAILEDIELKRREHVFKEEEHKLKMKIMKKHLELLNKISENAISNPSKVAIFQDLSEAI